MRNQMNENHSSFKLIQLYQMLTTIVVYIIELTEKFCRHTDQRNVSKVVNGFFFLCIAFDNHFN